MQILFAISILSFIALVWAGIAVARHIRSSQNRHGTYPESAAFAQHLFSAVTNESERIPRTVPQQTVKEITANKIWNKPPETLTLHPAHENPIADTMQEGRKAPQPSHAGGMERLDWAYFNKDFGDLSDPYQPRRTRANSRAKATSPKRF